MQLGVGLLIPLCLLSCCCYKLFPSPPLWHRSAVSARGLCSRSTAGQGLDSRPRGPQQACTGRQAGSRALRLVRCYQSAAGEAVCARGTAQRWQEALLVVGAACACGVYCTGAPGADCGDVEGSCQQVGLCKALQALSQHGNVKLCRQCSTGAVLFDLGACVLVNMHIHSDHANIEQSALEEQQCVWWYHCASTGLLRSITQQCSMLACSLQGLQDLQWCKLPASTQLVVRGMQGATAVQWPKQCKGVCFWVGFGSWRVVLLLSPVQLGPWLGLIPDRAGCVCCFVVAVLGSFLPSASRA